MDLTRHLDVLRAYDLVPQDVRAVLCVGSHARGWSNPTSDVDLCIFTEAPVRHLPGLRTVEVPLDDPMVGVLEFESGDVRYEAAYWTESQVQAMLDKVGWERWERSEVSLKALTDPEELLLERLSTGVALLGDPWRQDFAAALEDSAYRAFITTRSVAECEGKLEDAYGLLKVDDVPSATLAVRMALAAAVSAKLDSEGVFGTRSPKWLARRVQLAQLSDLTFEDYWALDSMAGYHDDPREWIGKVIRYCERLTMATELS